MAYAENNKRKGTFDNIDELNNSPKRKSFIRRIAEALKSLPEDDKDLYDEPVNNDEVANFKATLAALTHTTEPEMTADEYRASLKAARKKSINKESNIDKADEELQH